MSLGRLALALGLGWLALAGMATSAPLELKRGVGLHDWLNWSPLAATGDYAWPPYRTIPEWLAGERPLSEWPEGNELRRLRGLGFDFVRLSVDPGPLLANSGARRAEALAVLEAAVQQLLAADLRVVFNLHSVSQVPAYGMEVINAPAEAPAQGAYRDMVADVARMLAPLGTDQVALEPFNEPAHYPCLAGGPGDWNRIMAAMVRTIREVSPDLTIVATGACGGSVTGLTDLKPGYDDANLLYSFHMYEPHAFTHQRDDGGGWISGFPWPSGSESRETVLDGMRARMEAAGLPPLLREIPLAVAAGALDAYIAGNWDLARLEARFGEALAWAEANGIPSQRLFMGEFGVIRLSADGRSGAADPDRLRYLEAVRRTAERHGIPWSIWEYANPYGMSVIVPTGPAEPDYPLLLALGLL